MLPFPIKISLLNNLPNQATFYIGKNTYPSLSVVLIGNGTMTTAHRTIQQLHPALHQQGNSLSICLQTSKLIRRKVSVIQCMHFKVLFLKLPWLASQCSQVSCSPPPKLSDRIRKGCRKRHKNQSHWISLSHFPITLLPLVVA